MRKIKKFAKGGSTDRAERMRERRMADIEKDFQKALAKGKSEKEARAKRDQRIADAKDDYAKRTGADRTETRAAEKAAEAKLTATRRGVDKDIKPVSITSGESKSLAAKMDMPEVKTPDLSPKAPAKKRAAAPAPTKKRAASPKTPKAPAPTASKTPKAPANAEEFLSTYGGLRPSEFKLRPEEKKGRPDGRRGPGNRPTTPTVPKTPKASAPKASSTSKSDKPSALPKLGGTLPAPTSTRAPLYGFAAIAERRRKKEEEEARKSPPSPTAVMANRLRGLSGSKMAEGGKVKKYAKGGKIDGIAVRGKTRAMRKK